MRALANHAHTPRAGGKLAQHLHAWGGACRKYERVFDVQPQAIDAEFEELAKPLKMPPAPRGKQGKKT